MQRKSCLQFALVVAVLGMAEGFARTVSVVSHDAATAHVALALSAESTGGGYKTLLAAWAPGDLLDAPTNAHDLAVVDVVAPEATSASFTLPDAWRAKSGVVQFFLMGGTAPYARRFAYLRTPSAGPWIDTGVVPDVDTDVSVIARYPRDVAPFGVSGQFYFFSNEGNDKAEASYWFGFFGANNGGRPVRAPRGNVPRTFRLNATGAMIDGIRYFCQFDPASLTQTTASTLTLFARKNDGQTTVGKQGDISIYAAQIRAAGRLTHDFVPCETAEGVRTLYNRVDGTFCAVSGTGAFEAGDELAPDPRDCGAVESATEPLRLAPALAVGNLNPATGEITVTVAPGHDEGVLLAVAGPADAGTAFSAWTDCAFFAKIPSTVEQVTAALPTDWWNAGCTVRVLWKSADGFPYDREVAYVRSSGKAYMLTDWIPTRQTDVTVAGRADNDVCLTGMSGDFYFFRPTAFYYGFFGQAGSFGGNVDMAAFHTLRLGPEGAFLDGERKAGPFTETTFTDTQKSLPLPFRRNRNTGWVEKTGNAWIQSAQIRERGELVRDFVPCVSNDVAGLYDRVHGVFHASVGEAAFDVGETAVPATTDGDALAWSAATVLSSAAGVATWDAGGGAEGAFTAAANWEGDAVPDLASGLTHLVFATAGTSAQVTDPVRAWGLTFRAANDFALTARDAGSVLSLGLGGITLQDDPQETIAADWRYVRLGVSLDLTADQTWDLSANVKRRLQLEAPLSGDAARTLTITGAGALGLVAASDFAGNVVVKGGVMKILAKERPFGRADAGGTVLVDQTAGAQWNQFDATVDKPLVVVGGNRHWQDFYTSSVDGVTTNVFSASFTVRGWTLNMAAHSPTAFSGGGRLDAELVFHGNGPLAFRERPFTGGTMRFPTARRIHVASTGNQVSFVFPGKDTTEKGATLHLERDHALSYWSDLTLNRGTTVDLHGTCQDVGDLAMAHADDCVTSAAPAEIFAYYDNGSSMDAAGSLRGRFTGAVTFRKSGRRPASLFGANTSTGTLVAQNGVLSIEEGGSWAATDIRVGESSSNRKPTLRLAHNGAFANPRETVITLTTSTAADFQTDLGDRSPVLELGAGVALRVRRILLDGRALPGGWWGGADSGADHRDAAHFAGAGRIYVPGEGSVLLLR